MAPKPDHVYVIPPGCVDVFFRMLTERYGERVIGVLLSGLCSDGLVGLAGIKEHGGATIAQFRMDSESEEGSMAQAAIDSGMVDFVFPAAGIPAKLMEMRDFMLASRAEAHAQEPLRADDPGWHYLVLREKGFLVLWSQVTLIGGC